MVGEHGDPSFQWEREKFEREALLKEQELKLERGKQELERRRMWFVGIGVPVTLALVAAIPTAVNNIQNSYRDIQIQRSQLGLEQKKLEIALISQAFGRGRSTTYFADIKFLLESGLVKDESRRIRNALDKLSPNSTKSTKQ